MFFLPVSAETAKRKVKETSNSRICLPFEDDGSTFWFTYWGGDTKDLNHHHNVTSSKFAIDFLIVKDGKSFSGTGEKNEDYYCFGKKILSPVDGEVTDVIQGVRDQTPNSMNPFSALGNAIFIKHRMGSDEEDEFSILCHFMRDNVFVKVGDNIKRGESVLGLCGNSGNSSEAHLHFHIQNTNIIEEGIGMRSLFESVFMKTKENDDGEIKKLYNTIKGDFVRRF